MALFKLLKGSAEKLKEFKCTEGYAYFTQDDGKFYIDTKNTETPDEVVIGNYDGELVPQKDGTEAPANRICINQKVFSYVDDDILDCGGADQEITPTTIIFNCGDSSLS